MSVLEELRPSPPDLFGRSDPLQHLDDETCAGADLVEHAGGFVVDDFLPPPKPNPLGRALAVLAMLASVGAGASLTFAVLDYRSPHVVEAAAQVPAESTGSIGAQQSTGIPHSIWGPLVNTIPAADLLSPSESDAVK